MWQMRLPRYASVLLLRPGWAKRKIGNTLDSTGNFRHKSPDFSLGTIFRQPDHAKALCIIVREAVQGPPIYRNQVELENYYTFKSSK